jgi:DNA-directed RNA polymerase specialized sigma24 family protein
MQDDAELCCLAQQGDLTAASTLVDRHYARIYAYLRRLAHSESEAEDLTLAETAEVLGVSAGTVKNRLRETLDHLRRRLVEPVTQTS